MAFLCASAPGFAEGRSREPASPTKASRPSPLVLHAASKSVPGKVQGLLAKPLPPRPASREPRPEPREKREQPSAHRALPSVHPAKEAEPAVSFTRTERTPSKTDEASRGRDDPRARKSEKGARTRKEPKKVRPIRPLPPNATWKAFRREPWRRGYVTLFGHGKKWSGYLVGTEGEIIPASRKSLSQALSSWRTGRQVLIDERLIGLIADTSDEFGGRPIRIVSGYRESSYAPDSKHKVGQAFDFSIPGVPNEVLRDFLRSIGDVGVGYYPNSTHVHLDVRDKPTYWVDYSRPGQAPQYSYDRRVARMSPVERALDAALDALVHRNLDDELAGPAPAAVAPRAPSLGEGSAAALSERP